MSADNLFSGDILPFKNRSTANTCKKAVRTTIHTALSSRPYKGGLNDKHYQTRLLVKATSPTTADTNNKPDFGNGVADTEMFRLGAPSKEKYALPPFTTPDVPKITVPVFGFDGL